jgi:hypothetical protein
MLDSIVVNFKSGEIMAIEIKIEAKDFQWRRPPFVLTPYVLNKGIYEPDILVEVFNKLKSEDLYKIVFHDNTDMNLLDFMNFFSHPSVSLQIIAVADGDSITDIAGISWLSGLEKYGENNQRAVGNFCAFRAYQTPAYTDMMAKFVMEYWFKCLGLDIIVGMTPASNVLAVRFIKRIGFRELFRIPNYSSLLGSRTDCVVTYMEKDQYLQLQVSGG